MKQFPKAAKDPNSRLRQARKKVEVLMDTDIKSEVAVQANEIKHIQDDMDEMKADIEQIKKVFSQHR